METKIIVWQFYTKNQKTKLGNKSEFIKMYGNL